VRQDRCKALKEEGKKEESEFKKKINFSKLPKMLEIVSEI